MAFGRKQEQETSAPEGDSVPQSEVQPIHEAALRAREAGRRIFTCSVIVAVTTGSGLGLGGKKTTRAERWDPSLLIEAVEALGWNLERLDHVWQQTEHNAALGGAAVIRGHVVAYMQFRTH